MKIRNFAAIAMTMFCAILPACAQNMIAQNQSSVNLVFGPVVQTGDHRTPMTGLATAATITATGGTSTTITSAATATVGQSLLGSTGANAGRKTYITAVTGSGPYTLTVSPALASGPANGDIFLGSNLAMSVSKNGSTFSVPVGGVVEAGFGYYSLSGNVTDSGTAGALLIHWTVLGGTAGDPGVSAWQVVPGGVGNADLMNYPVDTLGSGIDFQDAMFDAWAVAAGNSIASYSGSTQTTTYYRKDGSTVGHTTTLTTDANKRPISRTYTAGTLP